MIAIIDYKAGNLTSVKRAVDKLGYDNFITNDPDTVLKADRIIFPGVGAAPQAMDNLKKHGIDSILKKAAEAGKPVLGICLGTQIILAHSQEGPIDCVGLFPGIVKKFPKDLKTDGQRLKIPHMGWNSVNFTKDHPVFKNVKNNSEFYFVHSYYPSPDQDKFIAGQTDYGIIFTSIIAHRNILAFQFHPEKSGKTGLKLLDNFCRWDGHYAQ
ncbi:MAG: imidazole glycerol phosphate synthase subunit HisH [bacterium]